MARICFVTDRIEPAQPAPCGTTAVQQLRAGLTGIMMMQEEGETELTQRQKNELQYHREHAKKHAGLINQPLSWEVIERPSSRWWNAYWQMFLRITELCPQGKQVLVLGCGFGDDALRLAKLGANVCACDLSPDSLAIAKARADRENLEISFEQMPAEDLAYDADFFDLIVARDIFHHVDIARTLDELVRVSKSGAQLVVNEIYSHSVTDKIRHSRLVENIIYPRAQAFVYGTKEPYITEDERKLNEDDIRRISAYLESIDFRKYFNFLVTRVIPEGSDTISRADRILLATLGPLGYLLAGRILFSGHITQQDAIEGRHGK